jgi:hypothetical protein
MLKSRAKSIIAMCDRGWLFDLKVPLGIPKGDACLSKKAT